jgi:hypothetical protein
MENPYYLWQYQSNKAGWMPIGQPEVNKTELEVIPETNPTLYRVIIANTAEEALNIASQGNPSACGMYAITNTVTANVVNLGLISNLSDGAICADGVDKNTLTLTVSNPLAVAATGVKVVVEIPAGVTAYNAGTSTEFTGFAEFDLAANGTKTLKLDLKSTAAITASVVKSIKSYIAKTFDLTWDAESALVTASSNITVNPVPTAKFAVASENICKGSTTTATNVVISNGSPNYTLTIGGTNYTATSSPYLFAVNPTSTTTYTLTKVMDAKGCYSTPTTNNKVTVNVEEIKITTHPASTSVCVGDAATFSVVASGVDKYQWQVSSDNSNWNNISGATASTYSISTTTASDNNKYYRVIVSKNGGKCDAVESNSAKLTVKTTAVPTLTKSEYKECATSGNVQLSTLFSGTGLKFYSDAALTNEVTTFSASQVVTGKKYYATQTVNGCTSKAAEVSVTVLELPKLSLATTDKTAICGTESDSKATLTYKFEGGKAPYTLSVVRTEQSGTSETITPSNLSATGTYALQPTTKTIYKFTQVKDANGCVSASASGLVDDVVIDVKRLAIISNLNDESVCADKKITYSIGAEGDDIKYQWYESTNNGSSFNKVGTNSSTYTTGNFAIGDKKQYKVVVSQYPEVCSSITSAVSAVTVNDCSSFELAYTSVKNVVCKEDQIELNLTLTNNSDIDATDVNVKISNLANQELVSSSSTTYNHSAGLWTIASLRKDSRVTLTIILKGTTVVKDVVSVAYISKSGSTTYTESTTQAKDTENITVKDITSKPTVNNYAACPEEGMLNLADRVTSDKSSIIFYTTADGFASKTQSAKNAVGTTSYWVTNTKAGECESDRTKLDILVYPQPTALISGSTTICKGESTDLSIALTGKDTYYIVLSNGDAVRQVSGPSTTMSVSPTATTTYTLNEVKDGNGCYATLSGSATITVNDKPTVDVTQSSTQNICDGDVLPLPTVTVNANGSTVTSTKWYFNGVEYKEGDPVRYSLEIEGVELKLEYEAINSCGSTKVEAGKFIVRPRPELDSFEIEDADNIICEGTSTTLKATFKGTAPFTFYINGEEKISNTANWSMTISEAGSYTISSLSDKYCNAVELVDNVQTLEVEKLPIVSVDATDVTLNCNNPSATITASGATTYEWLYKDLSGASQTKTGATLDVQLSNSEQVKFTTTYTIYGYSEKANCKSATPVTVNVTENKRRPEVETLISATSLDATVEGYKETTIITCKDTELFIKATIVDNVQVGYTAEELTYDWTYSEDGDVFEAYGTGETISTTKEGFFRLVVTDKETGCSSEQKIIEITENLEKPIITYIESYETLDPSGFGIKEQDVLTCTKPVIYLTPTIQSANEVTYAWTKDGSDEVISTEKTLKVETSGLYTLVVTDPTSFCSSEASSFNVVENKRTPVIEKLISSTSIDTTVEGYKETTVITCKDSELFIKATIVDTVGEDYSPDNLTYDWTFSEDGDIFEAYGTAETISTKTAGFFRLIVTDKETGCTAVQEVIEITENGVKPVISYIESYETLEPTGTGIKDQDVLTCAKPVIYLTPTIDSENEVTYEWTKQGSDEVISTEKTLKVDEAGVYALVVTDQASFCSSEASLFTVTMNKRTPIVSDFVSTNSQDETAEGYKETTVITCNDTELFIKSTIVDNNGVEYTSDELTFDWTYSEDGELFEEYDTNATISTTTTGIFKLIVTDKETGCVSVGKVIEITENKRTPVISSITSATAEDVNAEGYKETTVITCNNPEVFINSSIKDNNGVEYAAEELTYDWTVSYDNGEIFEEYSSEATISTKEAAIFKLIATDKVTGCTSVQEIITITENKRTPVVESLVSATSLDETVEGYKETQIINCKDTELFIKSTIVDNVAVGYSPEELTYDWTYSEDGELFEAYGTGETISTINKGVFRLVVTDKETGCTSVANTIEIIENKKTPVISMIESVTTIDPAAEEVVKTSELTCEYPVLYLQPTIQTENEVSYKWNDNSTADYLTVDQAGTYSLVVTDNTTFCSSEEYTYVVTENKQAPTFSVDATYYLCPSDTLSATTLSSLLPQTAGVTYKFYDESGDEIEDLYDASSADALTEYYVTGTSANGCESEKVSFAVDFAKNVDFTLTASQTSMLIGGNETVVTILPDADADEADTYTWFANGNEISVDGLEYSTNLYLDTKFEVTATNRCDSKSQEVSIEVLWPTAFTPHNANGKNDDFAKGMPIIVFNRFYTKIFEGPDGWDGTINGTMNDSKNIAVPGVYYYSVQLPNGEIKKGTIEIVRVD